MSKTTLLGSAGNGVTAWSYSRFADYKRCPLFFFEKHIKKNPATKSSSPAMARGSEIHKEGEVYLAQPPVKGRGGKTITPPPPASYKHFDAQMRQLKGLDPLVEQQWGFTRNWEPATATARDPGAWFAPDTFLRIVTDVTVVYEDHTADIIDFKTGKKYEHNQDQMELFSCGPFMKWPKLTAVTTRLWYLDVPDPHGVGANVVEQEFTRRDFERIRKQWDKAIVPMFNDMKFAPTPNDKCRWCPISKANGGTCKF